MKKIDGHLHLVRSLAGLNAKGRMTPLGDGHAVWDDGTFVKLIPDGWGEDDFTAAAALRVMDENLRPSCCRVACTASRITIPTRPPRSIRTASSRPFLLTPLPPMRWQ